jgi:transcriptional regulator with XRE-family HTH domain
MLEGGDTLFTNKQVGMRIRSAREEKGMTLQDVADKIGVAKSTIQRYEAGAIEKIKLPVIMSIASALDADPLWITGKVNEKKEVKTEPYYLSKDAAEIVQHYNERSELKILFDASKHLTAEDVNAIINIVERMKATKQ